MDSPDDSSGRTPPLDALSLTDKFAQIDDYWHPRIIAELNDNYIRIAKLKGEFVWHSHDDGDELFLVVKGTMIMRLRDQAGNESERTVEQGGMIVVPRGVEHMPVAPEEVHLVLIEPKTMVNTGDNPGDLTVNDPKWI